MFKRCCRWRDLLYNRLVSMWKGRFLHDPWGALVMQPKGTLHDFMTPEGVKVMQAKGALHDCTTA
eukprot:724953-Amphidinium_carterae.1